MTYEEARYLIANTPYLGGSEQEKVEEAILMAIEALDYVEKHRTNREEE